MTDNRIAEIEARVNAATDGRWEWQEGLYPNRLDSLLAVDYNDDDEVEDVICTTVAGIIIKDEDAALIVNAHADLRYLLARVRELESERDAAREALRPFAELLPRYEAYVAECRADNMIYSNLKGWVDWFGVDNDDLVAWCQRAAALAGNGER